MSLLLCECTEPVHSGCFHFGGLGADTFRYLSGCLFVFIVAATTRATHQIILPGLHQTRLRLLRSARPPKHHIRANRGGTLRSKLVEFGAYFGILAVVEHKVVTADSLTIAHRLESLLGCLLFLLRDVGQVGGSRLPEPESHPSARGLRARHFKRIINLCRFILRGNRCKLVRIELLWLRCCRLERIEEVVSVTEVKIQFLGPYCLRSCVRVLFATKRETTRGWGLHLNLLHFFYLLARLNHRHVDHLKLSLSFWFQSGFTRHVKRVSE